MIRLLKKIFGKRNKKAAGWEQHVGVKVTNMEC
jgi:hypothetical protein